MNQPRRDIRFTKTEDGVDIAYWEIGGGKPLVILNNFGISHAELEWSGKGFDFEPGGEVQLKGFDEPERVWKAIAGR